MSKRDVEQEAKWLSSFLQGKTKRGDKVIVMVVRSNPEELAVDVGCDVVKASDSQPTEVDVEYFIKNGAIAVRPPREPAAKKKKIARTFKITKKVAKKKR